MRPGNREFGGQLHPCASPTQVLPRTERPGIRIGKGIQLIVEYAVVAGVHAAEATGRTPLTLDGVKFGGGTDPAR
jgi:hypothetical protein